MLDRRGEGVEMSALPSSPIFVIVDRYGLPVGFAYVSEASAKKDLPNAKEDAPDRAPFRVQVYEVKT